MLDKDLSTFTPAEGCRLWRRQLGITQRQAAKRLKISRASLQRYEGGEGITIPVVPGYPSMDLPLKLYLARLRLYSGSLGRAARALRTSKVTYLAWEARGALKLLKHYNSKGFTGASG